MARRSEGWQDDGELRFIDYLDSPLPPEESTVHQLWKLHRRIGRGGGWSDLVAGMALQAQRLLAADDMEGVAVLIWAGDREFFHHVVWGDDEQVARAPQCGALASALTREPALQKALRHSGQAVLRRRQAGRVDLWLPIHEEEEFLGAFCVIGLEGADLEEEAIWALGDYFQPLGITLIQRYRRRRRARSLEEENRYFRERERRHYLFKDLVCESQVMSEVYDELHERVAEEDPILMTGEAGTGKELLARALHHLGDRHEGMLIRMGCAGFPEELVDFELFGCVASELTGALAARKGIFELAEGGTVFLDEIDRLSMTIQGRIVRVLQDREVRRIGDAVGRPVDARLIASSHRDLEKLCAQGEFRRDLFELLDPHRLNVPPLRERRADVLPLAQIFLEKFAERYDGRCRDLSPELQQWLMDYPWPGNVRQLQTLMEAAVLMARDEKTIDRGHLMFEEYHS